MTTCLTSHRAHDFAALMAAWHRVARAARLHSIVLGHAEGLPIIAFETKAAAQGESAAYLSTGVHGDEAAPPWGLLTWAEQNIERLRTEPFLIAPCLNPVGLIRNTRVDQRGIDLNRRFHLTRDPLIKAWQHWIKPKTLRFGLCLHEDYDAQGCYLYELSHQKRPLSEPVMEAVAAIIPPDLRGTIEGSKAKRGIIRRKVLPEGLLGPEAIVLHKLGCPVTFTFETPSEFALDHRIHAQRTCIEATIEHLAHLRS